MQVLYLEIPVGNEKVKFADPVCFPLFFSLDEKNRRAWLHHEACIAEQAGRAAPVGLGIRHRSTLSFIFPSWFLIGIDRYWKYLFRGLKQMEVEFHLFA